MVNKFKTEQYYRKLHELQVIDFVLVELTLYLDTHPDDVDALSQFNQFAQQRQVTAAEYEWEYGPLMQFGHSFTRQPWDWAQAPWPWQV